MFFQLGFEKERKFIFPNLFFFSNFPSNQTTRKRERGTWRGLEVRRGGSRCRRLQEVRRWGRLKRRALEVVLRSFLRLRSLRFGVEVRAVRTFYAFPSFIVSKMKKKKKKQQQQREIVALLDSWDGAIIGFVWFTVLCELGRGLVSSCTRTTPLH